MNEIIEFIHRRFPDDSHWVSGNCFYFASILYTRFPNSEIWYDIINNHFVCKIGNEFYDWNGIYKRNNLIKWDDYAELDKTHFNRIVRDCIM